jgi:hypothetical protein
VIVLPPDRAAEILAEAREQEHQEQFIAERVAAGEPLEGLFPLAKTRFPEYQAWLAQQQPHASRPEPARCSTDPVVTDPMLHRPGEPSPGGDTAEASDSSGVQ